jgi:dUTP pyrophosphatase
MSRKPEPAGKAGPKPTKAVRKPDHELTVEFSPVASGPGKPKCEAPVTSYAGDAGRDLIVSEWVSVAPKRKVRIQHNIRVAIPEGFFGLILPRSSTFDRLGLLISPGVIDPGFRGEVMALAYNPTEKIIHVNEGDRIAQILIIPVANAGFEQVKELPEGSRGEKGFGSTTKEPHPA